MATITGASVRVAATGQAVVADCFGNNMAILCPLCERAGILLIARKSQRGAWRRNAGRCPACRGGVYITSGLDSGVRLESVEVATMTAAEADAAAKGEEVGEERETG